MVFFPFALFTAKPWILVASVLSWVFVMSTSNGREWVFIEKDRIEKDRMCVTMCRFCMNFMVQQRIGQQASDKVTQYVQESQIRGPLPSLSYR